MERLSFFKNNLDQGIVYMVKYNVHHSVIILKTISGNYLWHDGRVACFGNWDYVLGELDRHADQKITGSMFYVAYLSGLLGDGQNKDKE